jgi:predicted dehydrogenase
MSQPAESAYGLPQITASSATEAPQLEYLPHCPADHLPAIGLIGAGGISQYHLQAYRKLGLNVVAICDVDLERAARRSAEFYPAARTFSDYRDVLALDEIAVVDVATHPAERLPILEAAIRAGKHALSQKPFVTDLDDGERLVDLADARQVRLAVNQNGRWAPHFRYLLQAVRQQVVGAVSSIDFCVQWDHTWIVDTPFNRIHHLLLWDFAIHWFDITVAMMGPAAADQVFAAVRHNAYQQANPPLLAHAVIDYPDAQVRMGLNGHVTHGQEDRTVVSGQSGTLRAFGPSLNDQTVQLWTGQGTATAQLEGCWFENGFQGTMGELLCAIAENREPSHSARDNLRSLELCFAAVASADRGVPVRPGTVRRLPQN